MRRIEFSHVPHSEKISIKETPDQVIYYMLKLLSDPTDELCGKTAACKNREAYVL